MGYSRNPAVIDRVKPLLDQMITAQSSLAWPSKNSHMLGYYIREAMTLAKRKKVEPYHELKDRFVIRDKGDRIVAELKTPATIEALREAMAKVVLAELVSLYEVIGGAVNTKADELYYPDADLSQDDLAKLYAWAVNNKYFLIVSEEDGVTLTREDPGELKWTPEDLQ